MKFSSKREALLYRLQAVNNVIERRQALPVLANVLVQAEDGRIVFCGTDMEVEILIKLENQVERIGSSAIPARKFLDICRSLPIDAYIDIEVVGDKVVLKSGRSRFTLMRTRTEEFPAFGAVESELDIEMEGGLLAKLMAKTQFAMAHQDVRYYLNGLLFNFEDSGLTMVATDGHRLAKTETAIEGITGKEKQIIVPRKGVMEISRALNAEKGQVKLLIGKSHVKAICGSQEITSKLIDGRFPDYEKVIPKGSSKKVYVDRAEIKDVLTRVSILSSEKFKGVRLNLEKGQLKALAHTPDQEEAEEIIDVEYSGPPMEIGFNVTYIIDALSVIEEESVCMGFTDINSSCVITGKNDESSRYVVMPMRI